MRWEGKMQSGKGRRYCFGDVHVCVQPRMGIFFFQRCFCVLVELTRWHCSCPVQWAVMNNLYLLLGIKIRLVLCDLVPSGDIDRQE